MSIDAETIYYMKHSKRFLLRRILDFLRSGNREKIILWCKD